MTLMISSSAFSHNSNIPAKYTCLGKDVSPPLEWSGVPENSKSLVLIVTDPDAPDPSAPKTVWVHWVLYNMSPQITSLPEAVNLAQLPFGAREGLNDWKRIGYGGPCPPIGKHRYYFKLTALDCILPDKKDASKTNVESAMQGHVIASAELIGTFSK